MPFTFDASAARGVGRLGLLIEYTDATGQRCFVARRDHGDAVFINVRTLAQVPDGSFIRLVCPKFDVRLLKDGLPDVPPRNRGRGDYLTFTEGDLAIPEFSKLGLQAANVEAKF